MRESPTVNFVLIMVTYNCIQALPESGPLPSVNLFVECFFSDTRQSPALGNELVYRVQDTRQRHVCRVANTQQRWRSAKGRQRPSKANGRQPLPRAEDRYSAKRLLCRAAKTSLPSVFFGHSAQHIFIFFNFGNQIFCGMFIHYVDLHVLFWDNYNRVFNR
jgi:hypothetical protein